MKNSEIILGRLVEDASKFSMPEKRIGTLERLKNACDLLADGVRLPVQKDAKPFSQQMLQKINPSNIDKVVRANGWPGPTRSFIANKQNGLLEYVAAREEERVTIAGDTQKFSSQTEDLLSEISNVEIRQAVRREIERRRIAEQELKIIKSGLKTIPQIDVRALLRGPITTQKMETALPSASCDAPEELKRLVRTMLERLSKTDLRHMGLKRAEGDILSMNNAIVILEVELRALAELSGLPLTLLNREN